LNTLELFRHQMYAKTDRHKDISKEVGQRVWVGLIWFRIWTAGMLF
jgi:hypothetical protein